MIPDKQRSPQVQDKIDELKARFAMDIKGEEEGSKRGFDRKATDDMYHALNWYWGICSTRDSLAAVEQLIASKKEELITREPSVEKLQTVTERDGRIIENQVSAMEDCCHTIEEMDKEFGGFSRNEISEIRQGIFIF